MKPRSLLTALIVIAVASPAFAQTITLQEIARAATPPSEAVIYTAREIITMDPDQPRAEAVAVVNGRIAAVGTRAEVGAFIGDQPARLDRTFDDMVLVPGFLAQHVHPLLAALTMSMEIISIEDWVLPSGMVPAVRDAMGYRERLAKALAEDDGEDPFFTWGFHHYFHDKLTRADLDAIEADRPVVVWHRSCHEFILNSAAMEQFGVTPEFFDTFSASAKLQSNFDEGHFWEQGAFAVGPRVGPALATPERLRTGLEFVESYFHANGITVATEPGGIVSKPLQEAQNAVLSDSDTPFHTNFIPDGKTMAQIYEESDIIDETVKLLDWGSGMTAFLPQQAKLFADGAIYSQAMKMRDGYLDGHEGEWMMDLDVFATAFRVYWEAGYQIHIHTNGDAGLDMVLDNLEANMRRRPRQDHRTTIVHFGFSAPDQVERIAELGAIVSANPYYLTALSDRYGEVGLGPERSDEMVRLGDVKRAGVSFSLHSDMPMAPAQPLFLMWCAVNRTTFSGRIAGPEQRISAEDALRAVTIDAAYSLRLEEEIGSIESGKSANFTVLEESPLDVPPDEIKDIRVWGTVLAGRVQPVSRKQLR